ncbi:MAG: serine--tRNA ligase [Verrucomicrobia bacterium GWF2_51_19]|nr:MAG: serine--tRNA ligase [Verrucomicrobia bacterium GWF2_51_19]HCJ11958.1 serine--tRNA ligase [Opitutae bacterium]
MIDLQILRERTEWVRQGISKKKFEVSLDAFLKVDGERREKIRHAEEARARQKAANTEMAALKKGSPAFLEKVKEMQAVSAEVKAFDQEAREIEEKWRALYLTIPNVPHESVPLGKNDKDNVAVAHWGNTEAISPYAMPHYDIPWFSKAIDFPRGVKATGAGFPFYIGDMARLVRSMITYFLDEARKNGYTEFLPPIVVNAESATATGQLPDKEGMMYCDTNEGYYLVPTAEVPVTNFFRDEIVEEADLPLYRCAYTPCFRREAGSWGKDVRGLNRLHQFDKVELVKWVHPKTSFQELESIRANAESLLQGLELPYRVVGICTGDIGFPHSKQYDLEVWAGGQKRWLEVSSCSNFTDFQARRANIRFRSKETGKPEVVHTLNGSGLAIPRVLAALLENNIQKDFSIKLPKVLHGYMGGQTTLVVNDNK